MYTKISWSKHETVLHVVHVHVPEMSIALKHVQLRKFCLFCENCFFLQQVNKCHGVDNVLTSHWWRHYVSWQYKVSTVLMALYAVLISYFIYYWDHT